MYKKMIHCLILGTLILYLPPAKGMKVTTQQKIADSNNLENKSNFQNFKNILPPVIKQMDILSLQDQGKKIVTRNDQIQYQMQKNTLKATQLKPENQIQILQQRSETELNLANGKLTLQGIINLFTQYDWPNLINLDLSSNNIGSDEVIAIVQAIRKLKKLTLVDFSNNFIDDRGLAAIGNNLLFITILSLDDNDICYKQKNLLVKLAKLSVLSLNSNKIDHNGVKAIVSDIGNLENFTRLDLDDNKLSNKSFDPLKSLIIQSKNLIYLNFFNNNIDQQITTKLKKKLADKLKNYEPSI